MSSNKATQHNGENKMKNLYNSLLLKGYSEEAAATLAAYFPESSAEALYDVATEGTKEELMKLCEHDTDLYDKEKDEFRPVTWDYIVKKYEGFDLPNGNFIIISSHQQ